MVSSILARGGRLGGRAGPRVRPRTRCASLPGALGQARVQQALHPAAPFLLPGPGMPDGAYTDDEQRVLEQVARLARALREDRERLMRQLTEVEAELHVLAWTLEVSPPSSRSRHADHPDRLAPKISS